MRMISIRKICYNEKKETFFLSNDLSIFFTMLITSILHGLKICSLPIGMGKISHYACWPAREINQDDKTCVTMAMTATMLRVMLECCW